MKKFEQKDVFTNTLKTYPKVKIFSLNGKLYYKSITVHENGPVINDFLQPPVTLAIPTGAITEELGDPLLTEDGDYIVIE